jgi:lipoprotein NlpI
MFSYAFLGIGMTLAGNLPIGFAAESVAELHAQATMALKDGSPAQALELATRAVKLETANPATYLFRGKLYEVLGRHEEAIADFTKTTELDPNAAEAFDRRGSEWFKLGRFAGSIADFDRFIALKPSAEPGHWKRGIAYYYAGEYDKGRKQFEGYEKVDTNDVENAVWRFLCMAKVSGSERAREAILKVASDKRVPMMRIYDLFAGTAKPEDVLAAARQGEPSPAELNQRLFYAHLYLGLYFDASGDRPKAIEHLAKAAEEHRIGHYMWDVARVHLALLRKNQVQR